MYDIPRDKYRTPILQSYKGGDWKDSGDRVFNLGKLLASYGFISNRDAKRMNGQKSIVFDFPKGSSYPWRTWVTTELTASFSLPRGTAIVFSAWQHITIDWDTDDLQTQV